MDQAGIPVEACLVVDNSVLAMLSDYYCHHNASRLRYPELLAGVEQWLIDTLDRLRAFTPDKLLHTTDWVADEYQPENGRLGLYGDSRRNVCRGLRERVKDQLVSSNTDQQSIEDLRRLPGAPYKLIGPRGLSDSDLSLVVRAFRLAEEHQQVYLLTNDRDLQDFVTWLRVGKRTVYQNPLGVTALYGLTYFEAVHRSCSIDTDTMTSLLAFGMSDYVERLGSIGHEKGRIIWMDLVHVQNALVASAGIKAMLRASIPPQSSGLVAAPLGA